MIRYSVAGRSAAPSAGGDPYAVFWNPSTTKTIYLVGVELSAENVQAHWAYQRCSTRGTPGSTVTPDIDNDYNRAVAPQSGAELNLADFTVLPTLQGPRQMKANTTNDGGAYGLWFDGLAIPQSTGLELEVVSGLAVMVSTWIWDE